MHNPPHPGETIREDCIAELGLTVSAAAEGLDVSLSALSDVINGHVGISPEMAMRFELAGWGVAEGWLRAQMAYDLWQVKQRAPALKVRRMGKPEPA